MADELLLTIDGHSMAFRAFYALPPEMVARDGTPTNAVYGFASMLSNVIGQYNPTHLVVAFDTAAPTFRVEKDDQYKAHRDETPELFIPQVELICDMLEAMNILVCTQDGMEADDIIATYATQARDKKMASIHVTGDRDYFQLVEDPFINVMYVRRGVSDTVLYDEAGIIERTGIRPTQYVDYAAMRGDPSDNLPGIAGVGEKTAAKLLNAYENLEGIYENLDQLPNKQRENLESGRERVFLNREMMTLVRDVDDIASLDELKRVPGDAGEIQELCERLQFRSMSKRLLSAALVGSIADTRSPTGSHAKETQRTPDGKRASADADKVANKKVAKGGGEISADRGSRPSERAEIEDASLVTLTVSKLVAGIKKADGSVGMYLEPQVPSAHVDEAIAFPLTILTSYDDVIAATKIKDVAELTKLLSVMIEYSNDIVGYDIKTWGAYFALCCLNQIDCNDLFVMASLDDAARGKKSFEQMCASYLGVAPVEAPAQLGFDGFETGDKSAAEVLQISRVFYLREMFDELNERLTAKKLNALYGDIERPLTPVIAEIETHGVLVDRKRLAEISKDVHERCAQYEQEIHSYAGEPINVNSTQQLRRILFDQLGLTPIKKTKTGPSTDAATLHALRDDHPIVEAILRYREVEKLRSTYIDALGPLIGSDGRIHATFNQAGSATGRISSEAPNLQNIPIRTEEGKKLRTMFVAPKGSVLCSIDYSQIELRILAHLSKEKALVDAFQRGEDVHATTAAHVFEVDLEDVTSEQRSFAKVVNFGIAYGMESYGLATRMGIDPGHAKEILDSYWSTFSSMKKYLDNVVVQAKKVGYTETMFGRRRYFPELSSPIAKVKIAGARAATNAPIQGTAADVFKLAMVNVGQVIAEQGLPAHMVLTVHDELVFEIREDSIEEVSDVLVSTMENVVELDVPLVADVGIGPNWAEAK
ncbi:MAG TPA: DNA polymerase I [Acidimicrobiia bacterium]|nr:DNA polymerase I [Acidimicrobiia bacterium]